MCVESPNNNLLAFRVKAAQGQYLKSKISTHRQFQPLEIVKQITIALKSWRRYYSFLFFAFFLSESPHFLYFLHFSPLGRTSPRVCSCLLSLSAGLAHWGRDRWIDLAGTHSQPGNVRKSCANTEMVQMDLTCCCFLFLSNISIFFPCLSPHMCLNTYSAGSRRGLCSYRLRIGH